MNKTHERIREMKEMPDMRQYFIDNCINFAAFARKHELDETILSKVLSGKLKGERDRGGEDGRTAKVVKVLWELGIWKGEKPKILQKIENDERGGNTSNAL